MTAVLLKHQSGPSTEVPRMQLSRTHTFGDLLSNPLLFPDLSLSNPNFFRFSKLVLTQQSMTDWALTSIHLMPNGSSCFLYNLSPCIQVLCGFCKLTNLYLMPRPTSSSHLLAALPPTDFPVQPIRTNTKLPCHCITSFSRCEQISLIFVLLPPLGVRLTTTSFLIISITRD